MRNDEYTQVSAEFVVVAVGAYAEQGTSYGAPEMVSEVSKSVAETAPLIAAVPVRVPVTIGSGSSVLPGFAGV